MKNEADHFCNKNFLVTNHFLFILKPRHSSSSQLFTKTYLHSTHDARAKSEGYDSRIFIGVSQCVSSLFGRCHIQWQVNGRVNTATYVPLSAGRVKSVPSQSKRCSRFGNFLEFSGKQALAGFENGFRTLLLRPQD